MKQETIDRIAQRVVELWVEKQAKRTVYLNLKDTAKHYGITPPTVRKRVSEGLIVMQQNGSSARYLCEL